MSIRLSSVDSDTEEEFFYDALSPAKDDEENYFEHAERSKYHSDDNVPYVRLQNLAGLSSPLSIRPHGSLGDDDDDGSVVGPNHHGNHRNSSSNHHAANGAMRISDHGRGRGSSSSINAASLISGGLDEDGASVRDSVLSSLSSYSEALDTRRESLLDSSEHSGEGDRPGRRFSSPISLGLDVGSDKKPGSEFESDVIAAFKKIFGDIPYSVIDDGIPTISRLRSLSQGNLSRLRPDQRRATATAAGAPSGIKLNKHSEHQDPILSGCVQLHQVLTHHIGAVWVMKFSPDGKYLCSGGQDAKAIVWIVGATPAMSAQSSVSNLAGFDDIDESQSQDSKEESQSDSQNSLHQYHNVLSPEPYRIFEGHTSDIVDIAWSKSNFILTASLDKTVSLWLVSSTERIQFFNHPDIVTSVDFHPIHDRYFISGCFDRRLRFWDILPDGHVRAWAQTHETITSVSFDPLGQTIVGGLFNGQVYFYTFDMKYITQINCRNSSGRFRAGKKVTGLTFVKKDPSSNANDELSSSMPYYRPKVGTIREKLIVTTNDNRIRLIQTEDYSLITKYRGLKNSSMQIKASLNEDGRFLICGSENGRVFFWHTAYHPRLSWISSFFSKHNSYTNPSYEYIDNTGNPDVATTSAIFAPAATVYHSLIASHYKGRIRHGDASHIDVIRSQIDLLLPKEINVTDFSSRIIVAADYDGKIRVYVREMDKFS